MMDENDEKPDTGEQGDQRGNVDFEQNEGDRTLTGEADTHGAEQSGILPQMQQQYQQQQYYTEQYAQQPLYAYHMVGHEWPTQSPYDPAAYHYHYGYEISCAIMFGSISACFSLLAACAVCLSCAIIFISLVCPVCFE
jgi:hypothetical protein